MHFGLHFHEKQNRIYAHCSLIFFRELLPHYTYLHSSNKPLLTNKTKTFSEFIFNNINIFGELLSNNTDFFRVYIKQ